MSVPSGLYPLTSSPTWKEPTDPKSASLAVVFVIGNNFGIKY